jgi:hypothetical protein
LLWRHVVRPIPGSNLAEGEQPYKNFRFASGSLLVLLPVASGFASGFGLKIAGLLLVASRKPEVFQNFNMLIFKIIYI